MGKKRYLQFSAEIFCLSKPVQVFSNPPGIVIQGLLVPNYFQISTFIFAIFFSHCFHSIIYVQETLDFIFLVQYD